MSEFDLLISSPVKKLFEGRAGSVTLPGKSGRFTILARHAPLLALLKSGQIKVEAAGGGQSFAIERGFVEAHDNKVSVFVRTRPAALE
ncbi:MAG: F0F1 ATP synthase subunit epsilon [Candidatus Omnitrophica bacterium]|nr:F0F1 ATP synthase subunit epsilon [Candidatus Omnitrophota bacterium]